VALTECSNLVKVLLALVLACTIVGLCHNDCYWRLLIGDEFCVLLAFRHGFSKEMPNIALVNKTLNHLAVLADSHSLFTA
jgi:hypothetical protein